MKKILISSALAASLFGVAQAQTSGLFVGVNAGVPITTPSYGPAIPNSSMFPTSGIGWAVGLDVGYKQVLSENYGLKYISAITTIKAKVLRIIALYLK